MTRKKLARLECASINISFWIDLCILFNNYFFFILFLFLSQKSLIFVSMPKVSDVWKHFNKIPLENKVECKNCGKKILGKELRAI
ncbi:unnamed protein product [Meloidogyne enterolobii]|uniref:Uncharacterized protein n=1 Tax=Meloidogyne enterolobii TaxID=390850 RepID=A0ACB0Y283_MELEN